jgi:hypothetical protein
MSRVIALYRAVARYRLDQLLPAHQRPRFFLFATESISSPLGPHHHTSGRTAPPGTRGTRPGFCQIRAVAVNTQRSAAS